MASNPEIRGLERELGQFLNKQLQQICGTIGLRTSGVKAELQNRIKNALLENYHADPGLYQQLKTAILNARGSTTSRASAHQSSGSGLQSQNHASRNSYPYGGSVAMPHSSYGQAPNGYSSYGGSGNGHANSGYRGPSQMSTSIQFKHSPFYTVETQIGDVQTCEIMSQHRNSVQFSLRANDHAILQRCQIDKNLRIMVFCSSDTHGQQDITFPHQSEIKVNGGEVRANLRGLKGKPGSTRPVDITDALRLKQAAYVNNVEFTYALTNKKFYIALFVCRTIPVVDLVAKIKGKKIGKASVIQELSRKANDPDVVATSQNLSLKCPLSYTRLRVPCRSILCSHVSCFDATSYLQLQEQGPQWICPVCSKSAPFENLAIDEYVKDILDNTSDSTDQVTIEPDGQWRREGSRDDSIQHRPSSGMGVKAEEEDDDLSILSDMRGFNPRGSSSVNGSFNFGTPNASLLMPGTPNGTSTATAPPSAPRSTGKKRTAEVIDLTLSSDEDDEPIIRAPKRQNQGHTDLNGHMPYLPFNNY